MTHHRFRSFWEMFKIEASAFLQVQRVLGEIADVGVKDASWLAGNEGWISQNLSLLEIEMGKLDLPVSKKKLAGVQNLLRTSHGQNNFPVLAEIFKQNISELRARIEDELESKFVFCVNGQAAEYIGLEKSIIDENVEKALPESITDLHEARACIAVSRCTASVFHLMRAMEDAVSKVGSRLQVTILDRNGKTLQWGTLISNIKTKVDALPKDKERDNWQALVAMLYSVKEAWRNNTMHPKQTYSEDEAIEVYMAVRAFIRRLAKELA